MMLAVAGILSARLLIKPFEGQKHWEKFISPALLAWGLLWLVGDFTFQVIDHYPEKLFPSILLIFLAILSLCLGIVATRFKPLWKHAFIAAFTLFLGVLLMAVGQFALTLFSTTNFYRPSLWYGWLAWPIVICGVLFSVTASAKIRTFPTVSIFVPYRVITLCSHINYA